MCPTLLPTGATVEMELIRWWVWEVLIHCCQHVIYEWGQWLTEIVGSVLLALLPWWVYLVGESSGWKIVHMEFTMLYYWAVWARSLYCLLCHVHAYSEGRSMQLCFSLLQLLNLLMLNCLFLRDTVYKQF